MSTRNAISMRSSASSASSLSFFVKYVELDDLLKMASGYKRIQPLRYGSTTHLPRFLQLPEWVPVAT